MDDSKQIEIHNKLSLIVKERQTQISELKKFYDRGNKKLYKEIVYVSGNLHQLEELFNTRMEHRIRIENLFSLSMTLGKIMDLNNSIKTILISLKVFEEHELYLKHYHNSANKSFIYKIFEKVDSVPLVKNNFIKSKYFSSQRANTNIILKDFYNSLYTNDGGFFKDFDKYLNFQMDLKQKNKENVFRFEEFGGKLNKMFQGSIINYFKFYVRVQPSFDLDYANLIVTSCDLFFMLYNKIIDKICIQQSLVEYIIKLDNYIYKHFIEILSDDLQKLSEHIVKKEMDEMIKNLDKLYN